jgi:hypothetical protein
VVESVGGWWHRRTTAVEVIEREVLQKKRRALLIYGGGHFFRNDPFPAYRATGFVPSLITQLESRNSGRVFTIWTQTPMEPAEDLERIDPDVASWRTPSLSLFRGTRLGAAGYHVYAPMTLHLRTARRFVQRPRDRWRSCSTLSCT